MKRFTITMALTFIFTVLLSTAAFAGTWKSDANGWWWDRGNGTWPSNGWEWCDGNNDGTAECYYFNGDGYCLINTMTPDGYQVNEDGAWVDNGIVQTQGQSTNTNSIQTESVTVPGLAEYASRYEEYLNDDGIKVHASGNTLVIDLYTYDYANADTIAAYTQFLKEIDAKWSMNSIRVSFTLGDVVNIRLRYIAQDGAVIASRLYTYNGGIDE